VLRFAELRKQRSRLANWSGKPGRAGVGAHLSTLGRQADRTTAAVAP
jgi:hypothetical protein